MQDYKLVLREITAGNTVLATDGSVIVQNASEFMSYLNDQYLSQGYEIISVSSPYRAQNATEATTYEFAYHLVKKVKEK